MKCMMLGAALLAGVLTVGCPASEPADTTNEAAGTDTEATGIDTTADDTTSGMDAAGDTTTDPALDTTEGSDATEGMTPADDGTVVVDPAAAVSPVWTADEDANAVTLDGGLKILIVKEGAGDALTPDKTAVMNYTGWLLDGTAFDSSVDPQFNHVEPLKVTPPWAVIEGWIKGIDGMKVGEVRKLYIPAPMAYGSQARGEIIKANSTLVFNVELVGIE